MMRAILCSGVAAAASALTSPAAGQSITFGGFTTIDGVVTPPGPAVNPLVALNVTTEEMLVSGGARVGVFGSLEADLFDLTGSTATADALEVLGTTLIVQSEISARSIAFRSRSVTLFSSEMRCEDLLIDISGTGLNDSFITSDSRVRAARDVTINANRLSATDLEIMAGGTLTIDAQSPGPGVVLGGVFEAENLSLPGGLAVSGSGAVRTPVVLRQRGDTSFTDDRIVRLASNMADIVLEGNWALQEASRPLGPDARVLSRGPIFVANSPSSRNRFVWGAGGTGEVVFHDVVDPGGPVGTAMRFINGIAADGTSRALFDANVRFAETALVRLEVAGTGNLPGNPEFDSIGSTATMTLGGTLAVVFDGFTPAPGDRFPILGAFQITGDFAHVAIEEVEGVRFTLRRSAGYIELVALDEFDVAADLGTLNFFDVLAILASIDGRP